MKKRIYVMILCMAVISMTTYLKVSAHCCDTNVYANEPFDIMNANELFQNDDTTRLPQTVTYKLVSDFMAEPLPEGKTEKKVLILGYDGYRKDALQNLLYEERSAIMEIAREGGVYLSYAGGDHAQQQTATAPGWASILTGGWAEYTGVYDNEDTKKDGVNTFLMEQANLGNTGAYIVSWAPHIDTTYVQDIQTVQNNALPLDFIQTNNDDETLAATLQHVQELNTDIIFSIFEYGDHAGHDTGYGNHNEDYVQAVKDADHAGVQILDAIKQRENYDQEDWLILITTDHGGSGLSHGGQSEVERETWLASNKPITITDELINYHKQN